MKLRRFAALSLVLAFSGTTAYADYNIKTVGNCQTIREPGSYSLDKVIRATEGDLQPVPGTGGTLACIVVDADFVTLDLQGYTIIGPGTSTLQIGIRTTPATRDVKVHSGMVTNFGVGVLITCIEGCTVEHINASRNLAAGIFLSGRGHRVIGNIANGNGNFGIAVDCPSVVLGNMAFANGPGGNINVEPLTCTRSHNSPKLGDDVVPAP